MTAELATKKNVRCCSEKDYNLKYDNGITEI